MTNDEYISRVRRSIGRIRNETHRNKRLEASDYQSIGWIRSELDNMSGTLKLLKKQLDKHTKNEVV